jgi:hypothetical protein
MKDFLMPNKKKIELKRNTDENEIMNEDPTLKNLTLFKPMSEDEVITFRKVLKDIKNYDWKLDDYRHSKSNFDEANSNFIKMRNNKELTKTEEVDKKYQLKYQEEELKKKFDRIQEIGRNKSIIERDYYPDRENREYFLIKNYKNKNDAKGNIPDYGIAYRNKSRKGGFKRKGRRSRKTNKTRKTKRSKNNNK